MTTTHTPGPWEVGYFTGITGPRTAPSAWWPSRVHRIPISSRRGDYAEAVAWVLKSGDEDSSMLADARLIAAAPDLLEAPKSLLPIVADLDSMREAGEPETPELVAAHAAIAKAERR